ncbi:MAG: hypothetical protein ACT4P1_03580 [Sporichthyaceae bacterium]
MDEALEARTLIVGMTTLPGRSFLVRNAACHVCSSLARTWWSALP